MCEKLKNGIKILIGQSTFELLIQNNALNVLINNSRTVWPTEILLPFLSFSFNLPKLYKLEFPLTRYGSHITHMTVPIFFFFFLAIPVSDNKVVKGRPNNLKNRTDFWQFYHFD